MPATVPAAEYHAAPAGHFPAGKKRPGKSRVETVISLMRR